MDNDHSTLFKDLEIVTDIVMRKGEDISVCAVDRAETLVVVLLLLLVFGSFLCQAI